MRTLIVVLEDDAGRAAAMQDVFQSVDPQRRVMWFDNAPDMIAWLRDHLGAIRLLCLDHDLGPNRERDGETFDPGVGRDVVDFLVTQEPACAVIIHSSNGIGAEGMRGALEDAGWSAERVVPYGDLQWVRERWAERLRAYLE